jgi:hypothetical protein
MLIILQLPIKAVLGNRRANALKAPSNIQDEHPSIIEFTLNVSHLMKTRI